MVAARAQEKTRMSNTTRIHPERVTVPRAGFNHHDVFIAAQHYGRSAKFHAALALLRFTNVEGRVVLTIEEVAKQTKYCTRQVSRALSSLVADGLLSRDVTPGGRVGWHFTWNPERVREVAEKVRGEEPITSDNVTCGQSVPTFSGAVLAGDNLGLESVALWKSSYVDMWDRRWAIGPDGRRVLGAVRPPWPRSENWPWFVSFAGELAGEERPLVVVVSWSCEALLKAGENVDPRIVEERHPLPFLKGRERVARYVARAVNERFDPRAPRRVEEERRPVEVPQFVHDFAQKLAAGVVS